MFSVVVKIVDRLVSHDVLIAEEQAVKTETVGEFEVVSDRPLVLGVSAQLVEAHASGRVCLTIVAVGKADD